MHTLAVIGQKGGTGKSTTVLGLAVAASLSGQAVAVIDLDPQATAANWSDRRKRNDIAVVSCQVSRLKQALKIAEEQGADYAIIDTPGKSTETSIAAAKVADLVLLPIGPQLFDIETLESIKDILSIAGNPPSLVIISRATIQGRRHLDATEGIERYGFDVCPSIIYQRTLHGDSGNIGLTALDCDPRSKAAAEIQDVYDHITSLL
jgi:chromosome partitioning protein